MSDARRAAEGKQTPKQKQTQEKMGVTEPTFKLKLAIWKACSSFKVQGHLKQCGKQWPGGEHTKPDEYPPP